jgi:hypothetical protein
MALFLHRTLFSLVSYQQDWAGPLLAHWPVLVLLPVRVKPQLLVTVPRLFLSCYLK